MRFLLFCLGLCFGFSSCRPTNQAPVLGYINSVLVMQQYHGTAAKRKEIELKATGWQRSLDSLAQTLQATHRSAVEQATQVNQYRAMVQQKLQIASQQADKELLSEVNNYLKIYGKKAQYDFIFGANESGNIVYATQAKDLTKDVLRGLNEQYDQHRVAGKR